MSDVDLSRLAAYYRDREADTQAMLNSLSPTEREALDIVATLERTRDLWAQLAAELEEYVAGGRVAPVDEAMF